jgi:hypothetical protein
VSTPESASPIEYVGQAKPSRERPAPGPGPTKSQKSGWWPLLYITVILGVVGARFFLGGQLRSTLTGFACDVTACSAPGMVTAGWLIVVLPITVVPVTALLWARVGLISRVALAIATGISVGVATLFIPTKRQSLSDLMSGPAGGQLADGITWAGGAVGVTVASMIIMALLSNWIPAVKARFSPIATALAAVLMVTALPLAISNAYPTLVTATEIFPAILTMNGDTLTRTAAADQRGCDGVLTDDALLNDRHCLLTVRVGFTTDDSDATVTFRAVLYFDEDTADAVQAALPDRVTPVGAGDAQITTVSSFNEWLLIATATHADNRPIEKDERSWVLWPVRQVAYYFIGAHGGLFIDPDPKDGIAPRTP